MLPGYFGVMTRYGVPRREGAEKYGCVEPSPEISLAE
jgi:hypothetical protein